MNLLPKAVVKLWGSNKVGVAAWSTTMLAVGSIGAPIMVRYIATVGIVLIVLAVIIGYAWEDAAQKGAG